MTLVTNLLNFGDDSQWSKSRSILNYLYTGVGRDAINIIC